MTKPARDLGRALAGICTLAALACAGASLPDPEIATGADAEVTPDGLHRLRHSGFQMAWVKPDAELAAYGSIVLADPQVAYKRPPRRRSRGSMSDPNFALTDTQMTRFKSLLVEAFAAEFTGSEFFEVVEAPRADTLRLQPAIIDLVVLVPTDARPNSERTLTTSTAVMTLLMELRDAQSGEILARIAERQEARAPGSNGTTTLTMSNAVNDTAAVRRTFRRWARILRERLDRVHQLAPAGADPAPAP